MLTLALAAGLTLFLLSIMPMMALGLMIGGGGLFAALVLIACAKAIIDYYTRPILAKGIAAGVVDSKGIPIVTVQEETAVIFTPGHQVVLDAILTWDITPISERVNAIVETAKKIQPCDILNNLPIAYPLGAENGGATRNLEETTIDQDFGRKWGKSLGVNGYICQVAKVWAVYTCVYNHIDDLRNTKDCPVIVKIQRMAIAIMCIEELKRELELERELRPKISVEAWEALSLKTSPPIIKRPNQPAILSETLSKKADKAEGIAETPRALAARA